MRLFRSGSGNGDDAIPDSMTAEQLPIGPRLCGSIRCLRYPTISGDSSKILFFFSLSLDFCRFRHGSLGITEDKDKDLGGKNTRKAGYLLLIHGRYYS
jgi:hypothetical protein